MNIAIFGGSFDPVHRGHFEIVRQIKKYSQLDRIVIVPNYQNPLKKKRPTLPDELRWEMLKTTFSSIKEVEISNYEMIQQKTSYTYATIEYFKERFSQDQLYLILGEDAFALFDEWAHTNSILELCKILVFRRPALRLEQTSSAFEKYKGCVEFVPLQIPDISATEIRRNDLKTINDQSWLHPDAFPLWKNHILTTENKKNHN